MKYIIKIVSISLLITAPMLVVAQAATTNGNDTLFMSAQSFPGFLEEPIVVPGEQSADDVFTRNIDSLRLDNVFVYSFSKMVEYGIPVETIVLTLMIPVLATLVTITRNLIGLPSLDTLVVISFSIALLASNIVIGTLLLAVILIASIVARMVFKNIRIMQQPKITLSMFLVSAAVLGALFGFAAWGIIPVASISVVPVLLLIIMSERIVRLQFDSHPGHAWNTVVVTLVLGTIGYYLLLVEPVRIFIINYPIVILAIIPLNIYVGRFFGLRLMERVRFKSFLSSSNS
jgi:hypothetical protein